MAIQARTEVKATLLLDFELPGVRWTGSGGTGDDRQLKQRFQESWQMQVTPANGIATAEVLEQLAKAIRSAMETL